MTIEDYKKARDLVIKIDALETEHLQLATWLKELKRYKKEEESFREGLTKLSDAIKIICRFCDLLGYHNRCVSDSVNYIRNFIDRKFYKTEEIRVGDEVISIVDKKTTLIVTVIDEEEGTERPGGIFQR